MDAGVVEGSLIMRDLASQVIERVEKKLSELGGELDKQSASVKRAESAWTSYGSRLQKTGQALGDVGRTLSIGLTAPLVAGAGLATKAFMDWEQSAAMLRKTLKGTDAEVARDFGNITQAFRDVSKEIPVASSSLNQFGSIAAQLGIKSQNIVEFTKVIAGMGVATNLSAEEAGMAMARMSAIMGTAQTDANRMASTIVYLGNTSQTTEKDIMEMSLRIAAAGKIAGLAESDVFAYSAALSSVGVEAEAGGTAISKVFSKIKEAVMTGGGALEEFAGVAGMSAEAFSTAFEDNAGQAIAAFIAGLGRIQAEGGNVFAVLRDVEFVDERLKRAMLSTASAGGMLSDKLREAAQAWQEQTALGKETARFYDTASARLTIFRNKLEDVGITIGGVLAPALTRALDAMQPLLDFAVRVSDAFAHLPSSVQLGIVAILGVIAAAGPLIWILASLISGIGTIALAFGALSAPAAAAGVSLGAAGAQAVAFRGVLATLGGVIARTVGWFGELVAATRAFGFAGLWVWVKDGIANLPILGRLLTGITASFGNLRAAFALGAESGGFLTALRLVGSELAILLRAVPLLGGALGLLSNPITATVTAIGTLIYAIGKLTGTWDEMKATGLSAFNALYEGGRVVWNALIWGLQEAGSAAVDFGTRALPLLRDGFLAAHPEIMIAVDALKRFGEWLGAKLKGWLDRAKGWLDEQTKKWRELADAISATSNLPTPKPPPKLAQAQPYTPDVAFAWQVAEQANLISTANSKIAETQRLMAIYHDELRTKGKAAFTEGIKLQKEWGLSLEQAAAKVGVSATSLEFYKKSTEGVSKATEKAADDVKKLRDAFAGTDRITAATEALAAFTAAGVDLTQLSTDQLIEYARTLDEGVAASERVKKTVPPNLRAAADAAAQLAASADLIRRPMEAADEFAKKMTLAGGATVLSAEQVAEGLRIIQTAIDAALAANLPLNESWLVAKTALDAARKSYEAYAKSVEQSKGSIEASVVATKALVDAQKEVAKIQQQLKDAAWLKTLPKAMQDAGRAAVEFRDKLKTVKSGAQMVEEIFKTLGPNVTDAMRKTLLGMIPAFDKAATDMRAAMLKAFQQMLVDAGVSAAGIAAIFKWLAEQMPDLGAAIGDAAKLEIPKVGVKEAFERSGFFDYFKTGMINDILGAIQGGGNIGAAVAQGVAGAALASLAKIGKDALTGLGKATAGAAAGVGAFFTGLDTGAKTGSKALGAFAGAASGAMQGWATGGWIGAAIGGLAGLFGGLFGAGNAAKKAREEFIKSAGGLDVLREKAKYAGLTLDAFFKAKSKGAVEKEIKRLEEAFAKAQERVKGLTTDLQTLGKTGALISGDFAKRLKADIDKPEVKEALTDFLNTQIDRVAAGFNKLGASFAKLATNDQFATFFTRNIERIGIMGQAAFGALLAQGKSVIEAIDAMGGGLDAVLGALEKTGQSGGAAFDELIKWRDLVTTNRDLFDVLSGLDDMMTGLHNTGLLTADTFAAVTGMLTDAFTTLTASGTGAEDALRLMQPQLQKLYELSTDFGYSVDDATQALLDQAKAAGLIGDKFRSAQDRMVAALDKLIARFDVLLTQMGVKMPQSADTGARGVEQALNNIRIPSIRVPIDIDVPEIPGGRFTFDAEEMARGGVVTNPLVALVGERGPEAVIPLDRLFALMTALFAQQEEGGGVSDATFRSVAALMLQHSTPQQEHLQTHAIGGYEARSGLLYNETPATQDVILNVTINAIDSKSMRQAVEDEIVPILTDVFRGNVRGARTTTRLALGISGD